MSSGTGGRLFRVVALTGFTVLGKRSLSLSPFFSTDSPHTAGAKGMGDTQSPVDILGEDGRSQSIHGVVGPVDHLLDGLELHDLHHWTEDLPRVCTEGCACTYM